MKNINYELIFKVVSIMFLFAFIIYGFIDLSIYGIKRKFYIMNYQKINKDIFNVNDPVSLLDYNYVEDTIKLDYHKNSRPCVYIYNTHQKEGYKSKTVYDAAKYLKYQLSKHNIDVDVENTNITEFMIANNIEYKYSYYASSFFIKDAIKKKKYDLIIDLHRDATSYQVSTLKGSKNYAKIMFVVGREHKNYKVNYALALKLNKLIVNKYPKLSRGVLLKGGEGVNGIYNQNLDKNIILIEIGGNKNSIEEVNNTIVLLAPIIGEYLYESKNN